MEATQGTHCALEVTWIMGDKGVPQPDGFLRILPEYGGQSGLNEKGYGQGAPELIVEVTGSTVSRDLGNKLDLYESIGVREYVSVMVNSKEVIWRKRVGGRFRDIKTGKDGLFHSPTFPGLSLDPAAFWSSGKSIRTGLERGLKSPEHALFVKKLAASNAKIAART